ncbi:hypothetical protein D7V82_14540 [bacterium 1xD8-6]|nr:hypothetical protein D7V72_16090 [bacterium D16-36]RKI66534.1 hypothetical protein D7V82_14540 [bacterium 1xD8-6]
MKMRPGLHSQPVPAAYAEMKTLILYYVKDAAAYAQPRPPDSSDPARQFPLTALQADGGYNRGSSLPVMPVAQQISYFCPSSV